MHECEQTDKHSALYGHGLTKQTVKEIVHECFIKIGIGKTSSATLACGHDS